MSWITIDARLAAANWNLVVFVNDEGTQIEPQTVRKEEE